jgi:hypothetical protein
MSDHRSYVHMITACDNLMKNPRLSLYEEVEMLKCEAQKAQTDPGVLKVLTSDLSFLIDRLSSGEKQTYLRFCEDQNATRIWDATEL